MYLVRDKETKRIIHINPAPINQDLKDKQVYYKFDPESMEIGKMESGKLPEYFDIDPDGVIQELSLEEQVKRQIIKLSKDEAILNNRIIEVPEDRKVIKIDGKSELVPLTLKEREKKGLLKINEPFEYINEAKNEIEQRSLFAIVKENLISTKKTAEEIIKKIAMQINSEILQAFPDGQEIKLMKDYMDWIVDGQPKNDARQSEYQKMQKKIKTIKDKYSSVKAKSEEALKSK